VYWIALSFVTVVCSLPGQKQTAPSHRTECLSALPLADGKTASALPTAAQVYVRNSWKTKYARPKFIPFPGENRFSSERELLGKTLFFDPGLSGSKSISCASCHNPGLSWTDGLPKALGQGMRELSRRTPTLLNAAWADLLFWDGRAESLEEQALAPISAAGEMNQRLDRMLVFVNSIPGYRILFDRAYPGQPITAKSVARAIATFERTIVSEKAPFDQWISGSESAISECAKRGFDLFNTKAGCEKCHSGWNFTDNGFHDIGLRGDDQGRGATVPLGSMQHAFKTPTLRNVDRRGPFMHDGSEPSLDSVIELYDKGGAEKRPSLAPEIVPLHLTEWEKADLTAFLKSLTSLDKRIEFPVLPR
jgi:cytochrome c peroxidase